MRRLVKVILRSMGVEYVAEATSGEEALKVMRDGIPDILITDWAMEPMNGLELTRYIRRAPKSPNRFMPIIMLTGYGAPERVQAARDAGVSEFIVKPLTAAALFQRVMSVVQKPRPFVRCEPFFGPDRRRHQDRWCESDRRHGLLTPPPIGGQLTPMTAAQRFGAE